MAERSYFQRRILDELGLTEQQTKIPLQWGNEREPSLQDFVYEDADGNICFTIYDLDGWMITHDSSDPLKNDFRTNVKPLTIKRLKVPRTDKDGKEHKYHIPKGAGTRPFFPPGIVSKFRSKESIDTLIITEGYIKALCGWAHGYDIIGLTSISTYRDKDTKTLHPDILRVITECQVKNIILLYDGDAQRISLNALNEGKDISLRPAGFFSSARNIRELLKDHLGAFECELYYAQVISDSVEGSPKGFDDLIISFNNSFEKAKSQKPKAIETDGFENNPIEILSRDLFSFSKPGNYFFKLNITHNVSKLNQHLHLTGVTDFYAYHAEILKEREFIYYGTKYRWNKEKNECEVIIPGAAKNYARVGDQYYESVPVPNKRGDLELQLLKRQKSTISDDYGKNFLNHVQKFKAFCNVPDHQNYQKIIHNCFNVYYQFEHEAEEGTCDTTLDFLKHIFGEQYELGLDYLQLLYQRPTQVLPILCLVSKENNTGKSTFMKLLKAIFVQNMVIVGNADLQNDFNAPWATRLIVCCEESFIDKKVTIEKIKALSTADKILVNQKGKDHVEMDFFGKFLLLSNNEDNFIYAGDEDIRYWVRKIPVPTKDDPDLDKKMYGEISALLHMLSTRQMSTERRSRMWFHPEALVTEALKKVRLASRPTVEKELRIKLRDMFLDLNQEMIFMTGKAINAEFFKNRIEESFLSKLLRNNLHVDNYYVYRYYPNAGSRDIFEDYEPWALPAGTLPEQCEKIYKVKRSSYRKLEYQLNGSEHTREYVELEVKENGRPFVFLRTQFVSANDVAMHEIERGEEEVGVTKAVSDEQRSIFKSMTKEGKQDDLPF